MGSEDWVLKRTKLTTNTKKQILKVDQLIKAVELFQKIKFCVSLASTFSKDIKMPWFVLMKNLMIAFLNI